MATEVLAVGIDFSFAPVLDLNDISDVIGDRGFAKNMQDIVHWRIYAWYETSRHGKLENISWSWFRKADSHVAAAIDSRSYQEIYDKDMQSFIKLCLNLML
jgi:beta-N-acetylhexosaminidase